MSRKKQWYAIWLILAVILTMTIHTNSVHAAQSIRNSASQAELFAVPEGGWSSINVSVTYAEYYNASGNNNIFNRREKILNFKRAYVSSIPTATLGPVTHSNNKSFTSWTRGSLWVDASKWDGGSLDYNTQSVTYLKSTGVTGKLTYTLYCKGASIPTRSGSVSLSLKTN